MNDDFVGAGWAFPAATDATGRVALVSNEREIAEAMRLILGTAYGERPMRPEFGCGIHDLVFAPAEIGTFGRIAYEVRVSLERWEPRVVLEDVAVTQDDADPSILYIDVRYVIRGTNDPRNLVFPFYVIPAEERS